MCETLLCKILTIAPPLLVAVICHEVCHGLAALYLGDPTARDNKRLTLNPLRHVDPFLTVLLPFILIISGSPVVFGGAKPVPVNPLYFNNPRRGMLWVALAGPASNFVLLVLSVLLFIPVASLSEGPIASYAALILFHSVFINLVLGLFNLLPVMPLDGGRIVFGLLSEKYARIFCRHERFGLLIVVALIYFGLPEEVIGPVLEYTADYLQRLVIH